MRTRNFTRAGVTRDLSFVEKLQRKFTHEVGFVPTAATLERIKQGNVLVAVENDELSGFMLGAAAISNALHIRPIYQACVAFDAQRRHHGLALLEDLTAAALADRQSILQCWCRQDIDANSFWQAAGFVKVALRDVNACRGEPCLLWRKPLVRMTAETLSWMPDNVRNHSGGGRSVRRHDWNALPLIEPFSVADVDGSLRSLELSSWCGRRSTRTPQPTPRPRPAADAAGRSLLSSAGRSR